MNIFSLLAFSEFLVSVFLAIYTLRLDHRSALNRVFVVLSATIGLWALGYTFVYPAPNRDSAFFWYRVSSIGWTLMPALIGHYFLVLTRWKEIWKKWWTYLLLYTSMTISAWSAWKSVKRAFPGLSPPRLHRADRPFPAGFSLPRLFL